MVVSRLIPHPGRARLLRWSGNSTFCRALLLFLFCLSGGCFAELPHPIVVTQVPRDTNVQRSSDLLIRAHAFDSARIVLVNTNGQVRNLTADFVSACDPDVSFDAARILFSGQKGTGQQWGIYELTLSDGSVRAVTPANLDARSPVYVSTLFTLDSPQPWFTAVFAARDATTTAPGSSLFSVRLDLPEIRQITFSPHRDFDPVQMWDGRLIYSSERYPLSPGSGSRRIQLFAVHIEGADVELFGGEKGGPSQTMPCPTSSGLIVFVEPPTDSPDGSGALCAVEERRPHVTHRQLSSGRDHYLYPAPLDSYSLLVARAKAAGSDYGIVRFDLRSGASKTVFDTPDHLELQAKLLAPRPRPDGHSSIVNPNVGTGTLYGLNAYDADPRLAPHLSPGTIAKVRFIEGLRAANPACGSGPSLFGSRRLVGEAPVESDGSFNVELPADTPLLLQTLDTNGMALATCGWFWVKTRESRGCIGCHEDPERIPENEYVLALRRPSNQLTLPAKDRRFVSFKQDVAPILVRNCSAADCHGNAQAKLKIPTTLEKSKDPDFRHAYSFLLAPANEQKPAAESVAFGRYIDPGQARTSWLTWQLLGGNTSRPWDNATQRGVPLPPPHSRPLTDLKLSPEDLRTIIQWIDLGAQYEP